MDVKPPEIATITITPEGVAETKAVPLAPVSASDLQTFDRTLAHYSGSKNTLINASAELLAVCGTISRMEAGDQLNATRLEMSRAIIDLKYKIVRMDYPPSVAENLCLLFAIALDELILVSPWGPESGWENRTLVADLFGFRDGGDRFYSIADRALMQPRALREFIEIIYILLKLGFRGKYSRSNEHERDRLIDRLESALNLFVQKTAKDPIGRALTDSTPPSHIIPTRYKLMAAGLAIAAIALVFLGLHRQSQNLLLADFLEKREIAEGASTNSFVFSSETGKVAVVPRK
jgi:type IV/VI secretion system ImpK/VasF family protein